MDLQQQFSLDELDILRERALRLAQVSQQRTQDIDDIALSLVVRGERFAVKLDSLTAVYEDISISRIPCTPNHVSGVANVRGRIMSVIDLGVLLDIPITEKPLSTAVIVASNPSMVVGFAVDKVEDVIMSADDQISAFSGDFVTLRGAFVRGILPDGTALLDMNAIMDDPSLDVNEHVD